MRGELKSVACARETEPWAFGVLAGLAVLVVAAVAIFDAGCYLPSQRFPVDQDATAVKIKAFCMDSSPWGLRKFSINIAHGSGGVLDAHRVVTADHVVRCDYLSDLVVELPDGRLVRSRVMAEDPSVDVAVIEPVGGDEYLTADAPVLARVEVGMRVCAVHSAPDRGQLCGTIDKVEGRGSNSNVHFKGDDGDDVEHGNSGSPVYDSQGRLVCLVTRLSSLGGGWCTSLWEHRSLMRL